MNYTVKTSKGEISLDSEQVLTQLLSKIKETKKPDIEELSSMFGEFLVGSNILLTRSPLEQMYLACMVGYYYRVFLESNDVSIQPNAVPDQASEEPGVRASE